MGRHQRSANGARGHAAQHAQHGAEAWPGHVTHHHVHRRFAQRGQHIVLAHEYEYEYAVSVSCARCKHLVAGRDAMSRRIVAHYGRW